MLEVEKAVVGRVEPICLERFRVLSPLMRLLLGGIPDLSIPCCVIPALDGVERLEFMNELC